MPSWGEEEKDARAETASSCAFSGITMAPSSNSGVYVQRCHFFSKLDHVGEEIGGVRGQPASPSWPGGTRLQTLLA
jgi:hypothetical protein